MKKTRHLAWKGAALGLACGVFDYALFVVLGVDMQSGGRDVLLLVSASLGLSYGVIGYLVGSLLAAKQTILLERQRALDNEKLASIGRLAAGVAHEVRNPLAVIRSSTALLLEGLDEADEGSRTAGRFIEEEIERLDGFIGALLDFSRPLHAERAAVSVEQILDRVARLGADEAARGGFSLEVEPAVGQVEADRDQVAQALFTLIVNAGEAVGDGGRVRIRALPGGAFEVADDGPGVEVADVERIFEPFFTTKGARGTGLGLPMAARIAEAHGGALALCPGAGLGPGGRGACFELRLEGAR